MGTSTRTPGNHLPSIGTEIVPLLEGSVKLDRLPREIPASKEQPSAAPERLYSPFPDQPSQVISRIAGARCRLIEVQLVIGFGLKGALELSDHRLDAFRQRRCTAAPEQSRLLLPTVEQASRRAHRDTACRIRITAVAKPPRARSAQA